MSIPRRNIIIACIAVAVIIVAVAVLVIVVVDSRKDPAVIKRCGGYTGPIHEFSISACSHISQIGYCEIEHADDIEVTFTFSPGKFRFK